ncbi:hypothetical protein BDB01DRAFT_836657 [Pilobolus umbonatus]|nr:hypothetical protein BDB01DRAFT_836657 [Pilobolus umbonatus]
MHRVVIGVIITGSVAATMASLYYVHKLNEEYQLFRDYRRSRVRRKCGVDPENTQSITRTYNANINRIRSPFMTMHYDRELHELSEMENAIRLRRIEINKQHTLRMNRE